jgi:hypothetical protein
VIKFFLPSAIHIAFKPVLFCHICNNGVIVYNKSKRVLIFLDISVSSFAATRKRNSNLSMKTQKPNNCLLVMKRVK